MKSRLTVGRRRSFIKDPGLGAGSKGQGPLEDVVCLPSSKFGLFDGDKIEISADRAEHWSPSVSLSMVVNPITRAIRPVLW
jgi:hypothetical protein